MGTYYYAVAALPMLSLSEKPLITSEDFINFCREQLSDKDFILLKKARINNFEVGPGNSILSNWQKWEIALRNELVKFRAGEKQQDPQEFMRDSEEVIGQQELAKAVFASDTPLDTERKLYEARWMYLEELGTNIFFTLESLIVYFLKLQLLEILYIFDPDTGEENFNTLYNLIREKADHEDNTENESNIGVNP